MSAETAGWLRRYRTALCTHIEEGPGASLQPALGLGRQAAALGLETLDLALIHEQALRAVVSPDGSSADRQRRVRRAKRFFAETIVPIEKTHSAALRADVRVRQRTQTLRRRTAESCASARNLRRGIALRRAAQTALKKSEKHHAGLLKKSGRLQERLRRMTRAILSAQEVGRRRDGCLLQDEIAQTLLGIHIRLLALRTSAQSNTGILRKEIALTQRVVRKSASAIERLAHELGAYHDT